MESLGSQRGCSKGTWADATPVPASYGNLGKPESLPFKTVSRLVPTPGHMGPNPDLGRAQTGPP